MRLAVIASHPIQYQAPLFRELAKRLDLAVFFAHRATPRDQAHAGFGVAFEWDVDLTSGYESHFLENVSRSPGPSHFVGCDTPEIAHRLRNGNFDAVIVMGWHLKTFWQAIWAAKRAGIPVLVRGDSQLATPRSGLKRMAKEILYPRLLSVFDAALYVGQRSKAYWEHYGYPSERLFFSPHCVDTEWFGARATLAARAEIRDRLAIAPDAKVVLFAGKLVAFKRPLDVVAALASLRGSGTSASLLVAGSGPLEADLVTAAMVAAVDLYRLGFCNQTEMPAAYAAADILALPSNGQETWGLVVNEAQACGVPILVSDACGCAPDLAADKIAGRVFPLGDMEAFAAECRALLVAPPSRQSILQKSSRYSLKAAADGVEEGATFAMKAARRGAVRNVG